jgi:hypothetical protein
MQALSALNQIAIDLEKTAEWRRDKAADHPEDERNLEAAELMERLADQLRGHASENVQHFTTFYAAIVEDGDVFTLSEINAYLGRIGFDHVPSDAESLLIDLLRFDQRRDTEEAA